jgi:hypothetical protein
MGERSLPFWNVNGNSCGVMFILGLILTALPLDVVKYPSPFSIDIESQFSLEVDPWDVSAIPSAYSVLFTGEGPATINPLNDSRDIDIGSPDDERMADVGALPVNW